MADRHVTDTTARFEVVWTSKDGYWKIEREVGVWHYSDGTSADFPEEHAYNLYRKDSDGFDVDADPRQAPPYVQRAWEGAKACDNPYLNPKFASQYDAVVAVVEGAPNILQGNIAWKVKKLFSRGTLLSRLEELVAGGVLVRGEKPVRYVVGDTAALDTLTGKKAAPAPVEAAQSVETPVEAPAVVEAPVEAPTPPLTLAAIIAQAVQAAVELTRRENEARIAELTVERDNLRELADTAHARFAAAESYMMSMRELAMKPLP